LVLESCLVVILDGGFGVDGGGLGLLLLPPCPPLEDEPELLDVLFCLSDMADHNYNNARLAYEYTKIIWDRVNASYDAVTTKLTAALGFSGLLLRFSADLSDASWLIYIKMITCILLALAIIFCGIGLYPLSSKNDAVDPASYLEDKTGEIYDLSEERSYLFIARGLSKSIKSLEKNRKFRVKCLILATYSLGLSALGFAVSIVGKALISRAMQDVLSSLETYKQ
jgi:hypothetical protein